MKALTLLTMKVRSREDLKKCEFYYLLPLKYFVLIVTNRKVYCRIKTVFLNRTGFITVSVRRPLSEYRTLLLPQAGTRQFALVFRSAPLGHILAFFFPLHIPFNIPQMAQVAIEFKLTLG
jgi:predicted CDP-diglyceride synthetase/phosphatidate cytidylyltransferase